MTENTLNRNLPFDLLDELFTTDRQFKADVFETDQAYQVEAELPGIDKDQVNIDFDENVLTIRNEAKEISNETAEQYILKERKNVARKRQFIFKNVDQADISATFNNGILTVTLPKKQTKTQINID
ncbi:HSP20 family protein [Staphylococcus auricularis]|uniref:Heat-shock protein n=1 Tax=Staphylococcus auricularis TaxID=29379 RepID=A0AAP8PPN6_9STAP|nr:Hsp20 family protein [Staphylococcus auricularis]MBM0867404.1 heat-shock protein [Staphylococcus auricularis]MCG7341267.1 Hsp20 family protein [Staphylococcus auricularis]MDC6327674.1 Hsp20 family protein [Staphylococcus auricularis]MDN4533626.1 Hsp20 family protein [Staphylococcus auricularis]PNZ68096.1 heat-shock protein [Staphylococcus auricularis]